MKRISTWLAAFCAAAGAWAAAAAAGWPHLSGDRVLWPALMVLAFVCIRRFALEKDRRAQVCFGTVGALFVMAMGLGWRLESMDRTGWDGLALCLALALAWGPAMGWILLQACRLLENRTPGAETSSVRRVFWISLAVLFVCWLPMQLAYFPCCFGYDMNGQIGQVNNHDYNTHHPLLHTLLVGAFYTAGGKLGSYTAGIWVYAILQMLALAASMAYGLAYLAQLRCARGVRLALTALFALTPQHAVMSIGITKDVPFAVMMMLSAVEMHKILRDPTRLRSWKKVLRLVLVLAGACLFRNNASMALAVFALCALLLVTRGSRVRMTALIAAALILCSGLNTVMQKATDAKSGAINEMLSVPAQQLARIYDRYGYDEPTSYEVMEWVPHADLYDPARADFTKQHLKVVREGELAGFVKFWVREAFHFPIEYIDAFLLNAKGYWFPDDKSFATIYGQWPEAAVGAFITEQYPIRVSFASYLPGLRKTVESLFVQNHYQRFPGLAVLIHPSTYTWLLLTAAAWALWRKRRAAGGVAVWMLMYLLTLFLGPCTLVRYCYYLMIAAPWLIALTACPQER